MVIKIDPTRDDLLTPFGKATLKERYLQKDEGFQEGFARAAKAFSGGDEGLAQRIYDYASKQWFAFASPLLSNGGTDKGLPISCFLNYVGDSIRGLTENRTENTYLSTYGGGIGSYWGNVRSMGEKSTKGVETPGVISFMHVVDSQMLSDHQGSTRRGAAAVYLDIDHPEIFDFINMRTPSGGDINRKNENLHHGVCLTEEFMQAVVWDREYPLIDPNSKKVYSMESARAVWKKILQTRLRTGEPYIFFSEAANSALPESMKKQGLKIHASNLCTEIMLPTDENRTAVCCLSSINVAKFDDWGSPDVLPQFISDLVTMLDNALQVFIETAPPHEFRRAIYSASQERSIGIGTLGLHTYLQENDIPFESEEAVEFNEQLYELIQVAAVNASHNLAAVRGEAPDMVGTGQRNAHLIAIAPNASSSIICGGVSPSTEPNFANAYSHQTDVGNFTVKNPALERILSSLGKDTPEIWTSILSNKGSVQHLDFLNPKQKLLFKTAFEVDQYAIINMAGDRQPYICQGQSVNLYFTPDVEARTMNEIHLSAYERGLKSLYYVHSRSVGEAEKISEKVEKEEPIARKGVCDGEVCTACEG